MDYSTRNNWPTTVKIDSNTKLKHTPFSLVIGIAGLMLLILLRDVLLMDIPNIVYVLYSTIIFLCLPSDDVVAFMITFLAFGAGLTVNYILGIGIIVLILKRGKMSITSKWLPWIALMVWELLHCVFSPFSIADYLRYFICMLAVAIIAYDTKARHNSIRVIYSFISSVLFVCFDIFLQTLRVYDFSFSLMLDSNMRYGDMSIYSDSKITSVVTSMNQNTVGEICVVSIAILLVLISYKNGNLKLNMVMIGLCSFFGMLTLSKTFFLVFIFTIIVYLILFIRHKNINIVVRRLFSAIVFIVLLILLINLILPSLFNNIIDRFAGADALSERDVLFKEYNDVLINEPSVLLFGVGTQNKDLKVGISHSPHNSIQELLVSWGIIGAFFMLLLIKNIIICSKIRNGIDKIPLLKYLPLMSILLFSQAGQLFGMNERMLYFVVIAELMGIKEKE